MMESVYDTLYWVVMNIVIIPPVKLAWLVHTEFVYFLLVLNFWDRSDVCVKRLSLWDNMNDRYSKLVMF